MAKKTDPKPEEQEEAKAEQPKPADDTPQGKTIDERMADLYADHKKMGAR